MRTSVAISMNLKLNRLAFYINVLRYTDDPNHKQQQLRHLSG
jgi:hypothetical protein